VVLLVVVQPAERIQLVELGVMRLRVRLAVIDLDPRARAAFDAAPW
jgi:hypothetical protein